MTSDSHINMTLSQGNAVKEIYPSKKHNFELQQQTETQHRIQKQKEKRTKIAKFEAPDKIQIKNDEERQNKKQMQQREEEKKERETQADKDNPEGSLIDIMV